MCSAPCQTLGYILYVDSLSLGISTLILNSRYIYPHLKDANPEAHCSFVDPRDPHVFSTLSFVDLRSGCSTAWRHTRQLAFQLSQ